MRLWTVVLLASRLGQAQSPIEGLTPGPDLTISPKCKSVRRTARNLDNVLDAIYKRRHLADACFLTTILAAVSCSSTQTTLRVAAHRVDIATIRLHKDGVLLSAAHVGDHNVKRAYLGQVVDHLLAADTELTIVVIYT